MIKEYSKLIVLGSIIALSGCAESESSRRDVHNYVCTSDEMTKVRFETNICSEEGGFFKSYCFYQAKSTICKRVDEELDKSSDIDCYTKGQKSYVDHYKNIVWWKYDGGVFTLKTKDNVAYTVSNKICVLK